MKKIPLKTILAISAICFALIYEQATVIKDYTDGLDHFYFLDVGQGDSALIKTSNRDLILIDAGPGTKSVFEMSKILPFWVKQIDLVVITHSHADHIGGMDDILDYYWVKCILYEDSDESISKTEVALRERLNQDKSILHIHEPSDPIIKTCLSADTLDDFEFRNFSADIDASKEQNLESIISIFDYGKIEAVFMGDAEIPVQKSLMEQLIKGIDGDVEIYKIPHHGANNGYYEPLLSVMKPEIGIISVGENNRYGHPSKDALNGYEHITNRLLRTDISGTIHLKINENSIEVIE